MRRCPGGVSPPQNVLSTFHAQLAASQRILLLDCYRCLLAVAVD